MTNESIEIQLNEIWNNPKFSEFALNKYLFPEITPNKDLLFIGINPSFEENDLSFISYLVEEANNKLQFFKKYEEVAVETNSSWTHLDLFFFRETKQNQIYKILKTPNGPEFLFQQLLVTDKLIKYSNPKIIVVCNALASLFLGKEKDEINNTRIWLGYEFKFDDKIGTYKWKNIPIFFSGMLSGQRALDRGSLERLKWHIKKVRKEQGYP